jgi:hypothetical protein
MIRKFNHSPYRFILLALLVGLIIYVLRINQVEGGLGASVGWLFMDGFICLIGFFFWLFFFSQFVLPVRSLNDRLRVYQRLWLFIRGQHGPAYFIENGEANPPKGEYKREGPGVIVLDTASAAVLRTDQRFTRPVGPGLVFTKHNEYLESNKAVVDLRLQKQTIGPSLDLEGQQAALNSGDPARIAALQRERMETRALTRDGIEIIPKISVYFKLDAPPGVGNSEFGYNPVAVERAIIGRNIDANLPPDTPDRIRDWRWIPAYLAADVWKESLSKYTLEELFRSPPGEPTALQQIMDAVQNRLTLEYAPALGDYGQLTGQTTLSQEYQLLLNRGIKVTRVEIFDLQMPESVEKLLLERWKSTWLNQARKESDFIQSNRSYIEKEATEEAADAYIHQAAALLGAVPEGEALNCAQTLSLLLQGSRRVIVQNPQMNKTMRWEMEQLQELIDWVDAQGLE